MGIIKPASQRAPPTQGPVKKQSSETKATAVGNAYLPFLPLEVLLMVLHDLEFSDLKHLRLMNTNLAAAVDTAVLPWLHLKGNATTVSDENELLAYAFQESSKFVWHLSVTVIHRPQDEQYQHRSIARSTDVAEKHSKMRYFLEDIEGLTLNRDPESTPRPWGSRGFYLTLRTRELIRCPSMLTEFHLDLCWVEREITETFDGVQLPYLKRLRLRHTSTSQKAFSNCILKYKRSLRYLDLLGWDLSRGSWVQALSTIATLGQIAACRYTSLERVKVHESDSKTAIARFMVAFGDRFKLVKKDQVARPLSTISTSADIDE